MSAKESPDQGELEEVASLRPTRVAEPLACWHESLCSARTDRMIALSEGGGYIETDRPLPAGTSVFLELHLGQASNAAKAEIDAVVAGGAEVNGSAGFGVRFLNLDPSVRMWIARHLGTDDEPKPVASPVAIDLDLDALPQSLHTQPSESAASDILLENLLAKESSADEAGQPSVDGLANAPEPLTLEVDSTDVETAESLVAAPDTAVHIEDNLVDVAKQNRVDQIETNPVHAESTAADEPDADEPDELQFDLPVTPTSVTPNFDVIDSAFGSESAGTAALAEENAVADSLAVNSPVEVPAVPMMLSEPGSMDGGGGEGLGDVAAQRRPEGVAVLEDASLERANDVIGLGGADEATAPGSAEGVSALSALGFDAQDVMVLEEQAMVLEEAGMVLEEHAAPERPPALPLEEALFGDLSGEGENIDQAIPLHAGPATSPPPEEEPDEDAHQPQASEPSRLESAFFGPGLEPEPVAEVNPEPVADDGAMGGPTPLNLGPEHDSRSPLSLFADQTESDLDVSVTVEVPTLTPVAPASALDAAPPMTDSHPPAISKASLAPALDIAALDVDVDVSDDVDVDVDVDARDGVDVDFDAFDLTPEGATNAPVPGSLLPSSSPVSHVGTPAAQLLGGLPLAGPVVPNVSAKLPEDAIQQTQPFGIDANQIRSYLDATGQGPSAAATIPAATIPAATIPAATIPAATTPAMGTPVPALPALTSVPSRRLTPTAKTPSITPSLAPAAPIPATTPAVGQASARPTLQFSAAAVQAELSAAAVQAELSAAAVQAELSAAAGQAELSAAAGQAELNVSRAGERVVTAPQFPAVHPPVATELPSAKPLPAPAPSRTPTTPQFPAVAIGISPPGKPSSGALPRAATMTEPEQVVEVNSTSQLVRVATDASGRVTSMVDAVLPPAFNPPGLSPATSAPPVFASPSAAATLPVAATEQGLSLEVPGAAGASANVNVDASLFAEPASELNPFDEWSVRESSATSEELPVVLGTTPAASKEAWVAPGPPKKSS